MPQRAFPISEMEQTSFLTPAVKCVESLQTNASARSQLFEDPRNVALASAISMIAYTAQFVEHAVQTNNNLHDIGIFVVCRALKHKGPESTKNPTFILWNSLSELRQTGRSSSEPRSSHLDGQNQNLRFMDLRAPPQIPPPRLSDPTQNSQLSQIPTENELRRPQTGQTLPGQSRITPVSRQSDLEKLEPGNPQAAQPQPGQQQTSPEESSYSVPIPVAAKCLELLLDGSGFSTHRHIFQNRSYTELGTKPLVDALKEVFKAEREERNSRRNPSIPSTKTASKEDMIYSDLLPDNFRSAIEGETIIVSVPEVFLEETGKVTVPNYMKVSMNIRKPDRNKKDQNFAVLCTLLDHTGPEGICGKTLREYARKGFTIEGCKRRKRYSISTKSTCSGSHLSCRDNRALCSFFISDDTDAVGKGTVDPYATDINGEKITDENILVRFAKVKEISKITFPTGLTEEEKGLRHRSWVDGVSAIWAKSHIQRIKLLGEYGKPIGTAIFVQRILANDAHESIVRRFRKVSGRKSTLDASNAIVVCDVVLTEPFDKQPVLYPFMEWYNLSCFNNLQEVHFGTKKAPKTLTKAVVSAARALLWSKNHFRT